jgi:hypothetical protein
MAVRHTTVVHQLLPEKDSMSTPSSPLPVTDDKDGTALLVIDPYNDFMSEGGKVWDRLKAVAEANGCVPDLAQALDSARKAG